MMIIIIVTCASTLCFAHGGPRAAVVVLAAMVLALAVGLWTMNRALLCLASRDSLIVVAVLGANAAIELKVAARSLMFGGSLGQIRTVAQRRNDGTG